MINPIAAATIIAALLVPGVAQAVETSIEIELATQSDFDRRTMVYDCADGAPFPVTYINAAPNFLALVPIADEPEQHVFVSVIAASGVRYVSGQFVWWTKGLDASLYDATLGEDAEAVLTCSEVDNTP